MVAKFNLDQIDDRWLDVDFESEKQYVRGDNGAPQGFFASAPTYEQRFAVIPEREWAAEIEKNRVADSHCYDYITRIYNQKSEGSCVSNATGQAHEIVQAMRFGRDKVIPLSAISLYKRCGRSPGSGSMLSTNLNEMAKTGILPLDTPENRKRFPQVMSNTGFYQDYPKSWKQTARLFLIKEWWVIRSVEGIVSALLNQMPVVVGRNGHSIVYCDVQMKNNSPTCIYANSWGNWGFGLNEHKAGFGMDSASNVRRSAGWAFAVSSIASPQEL